MDKNNLIFSKKWSKYVKVDNKLDSNFYSQLVATCKPIGYKIDKEILYLVLTNNVLFFKYSVKLFAHNQRIIYTYNTSNINKLLFTATLIAMFMFNGNIATFFFWATIVYLLTLTTNNILTNNYINKLIKQCTPTIKPQINTIITNSTISWLKNCPACGHWLTGFENHCPDCEINLYPNDKTRTINITNYNHLKIKYFN